MLVTYTTDLVAAAYVKFAFKIALDYVGTPVSVDVLELLFNCD